MPAPTRLVNHPNRTNWLATEAPRPRRIANWPAAGWLAVGTVCFGAFMGQLDASIVTLTFPALRATFHASLAGVQWVSLSYLLTVVALLAPAGRLADALGRKQLYLYGFALFTLGSAACGLAPTLTALIGFRVLQGVGAALLQANSVALVTTSVPPNRMRTALGVQAAAQALGLALGPTLGGILVDALGWQWVFGVNVPVGVLGLIAGRYLLPRTRQRTPVSGFDFVGLVLLVVASTALLLAVSSVSGLALPVWSVVVLLVIGLGTGIAFVLRTNRIGNGIIDLSLLRARAVSGGLLAALGGYLVLFGPLVLVPVVLTGGGASALRAGLVCTALPAGFGLAATLGIRLLPRSWSNARRCVTGALVCVLALVPLVLVPFGGVAFIGLLGVLGIGLGLFTPPNNAMVMGAIPAAKSALGGGLVNMARGIGTALGVAAMTCVLNAAGADAGARWGFGLLAVLGIGVAVVAALAGRRTTRSCSASS
ncbi:MAG TPA: MFS transporter [Pseudonocardiaceae bacterium]|nr:MFS transporter [Pseudonocardiaceae bacterium]